MLVNNNKEQTSVSHISESYGDGLCGCGEIVEIVSLGGGSDLMMINFTWDVLYAENPFPTGSVIPPNALRLLVSLICENELSHCIPRMLLCNSISPCIHLLHGLVKMDYSSPRALSVKGGSLIEGNQ